MQVTIHFYRPIVAKIYSKAKTIKPLRNHRIVKKLAEDV